MLNDIERVLISQEELEAAVARIGRQISEDFRDKDPIFVGVLKGCFIFMADLMRHVDIKCTMDFMAVSSYSGTSSTGAVKINKDLGQDIEGRHVIIVSQALSSGPQARLHHHRHPHGQARPPQGRRLRGLFLLRGAGRLRGRLWAGL